MTIGKIKTRHKPQKTRLVTEPNLKYSKLHATTQVYMKNSSAKAFKLEQFSFRTNNINKLFLNNKKVYYKIKFKKI